MTTRARRLAGFALVLGTLAVVAASPLARSAAAGSTPTWHLVDQHQQGCDDAHVHDTWFGVFVKGRWTHALNVGMAKLPAGGSYQTSDAPIPPGSSSGQYTLAYADAVLGAATPQGTYTAYLWASDGTVRQRVPVTLHVRASCGY